MAVDLQVMLATEYDPILQVGNGFPKFIDLTTRAMGPRFVVPALLRHLYGETKRVFCDDLPKQGRLTLSLPQIKTYCSCCFPTPVRF